MQCLLLLQCNKASVVSVVAVGLGQKSFRNRIMSTTTENLHNLQFPSTVNKYKYYQYKYCPPVLIIVFSPCPKIFWNISKITKQWRRCICSKISAVFKWGWRRCQETKCLKLTKMPTSVSITNENSIPGFWPLYFCVIIYSVAHEICFTLELLHRPKNTDRRGYVSTNSLWKYRHTGHSATILWILILYQPFHCSCFHQMCKNAVSQLMLAANYQLHKQFHSLLILNHLCCSLPGMWKGSPQQVSPPYLWKHRWLKHMTCAPVSCRPLTSW